jgi:hypothetical protein
MKNRVLEIDIPETGKCNLGLSLCCRGTVFLHCTGWYDKNNQSTGLRSVREAPLCLIYIQISLGAVSFERKGGEVVDLSYGVYIYIYVNLRVLAGIGRYVMK